MTYNTNPTLTPAEAQFLCLLLRKQRDEVYDDPSWKVPITHPEDAEIPFAIINRCNHLIEELGETE